ncbi:OsmC family protein [Gudongella oleilytica]|uniref:OsmC family protein n=1 Tax=Gudongella oleilytica TaxID=1582259 RepID=UPI0019D1C095|nr:OsmC family protein [Gudongella oleilytica]MDY0256487.1 OsmC family protein [Gudongella oleilytica]HMM69295.1 OsmC family protein [Gudongella oleilytica]
MAKTKLKANIVGNMGWEMDINGHHFITDADIETGGNDLGPRPKTMLLAGLIGCTGIDVKMILNKMNVFPDDIHIEVEAESSEDHPKIYTDIHLTYIFKGKGLPMDRLERAVFLSQEKYCGVTAMLKKSSNITHAIKIEE